MFIGPVGSPLHLSELTHDIKIFGLKLCSGLNSLILPEILPIKNEKNEGK